MRILRNAGTGDGGKFVARSRVFRAEFSCRFRSETVFFSQDCGGAVSSAQSHRIIPNTHFFYEKSFASFAPFCVRIRSRRRSRSDFAYGNGNSDDRLFRPALEQAVAVVPLEKRRQHRAAVGGRHHGNGRCHRNHRCVGGTESRRFERFALLRRGCALQHNRAESGFRELGKNFFGRKADLHYGRARHVCRGNGGGNRRERQRRRRRRSRSDHCRTARRHGNGHKCFACNECCLLGFGRFRRRGEERRRADFREKLLVRERIFDECGFPQIH